MKLQLANAAEQPEWVSELLVSGLLREMPKFSKFVHGTAVLNLNRVTELPYWWGPSLLGLWADTKLLRRTPAGPNGAGDLFGVGGFSAVGRNSKSHP